MKLLEQLINKMVIEALEEASPEAPEDAPFGQFLWADPKDRIRKDDAEEINTDDEEDFKAALSRWFETFEPEGLQEFIGLIKELQQNGWYDRYLVPPDQPLYRFISNLDPETAAEILEIPVIRLERKAGVPTYIPGPKKLKTDPAKNINLMSWTAEPDREEIGKFAETSADTVSIVFKVKPPLDKGKFFLNPYTLVDTFDVKRISAYIEQEMEVISVSPVETDGCVFFYNKITQLNDLHKKIWEPIYRPLHAIGGIKNPKYELDKSNSQFNELRTTLRPVFFSILEEIQKQVSEQSGFELKQRLIEGLLDGFIYDLINLAQKDVDPIIDGEKLETFIKFVINTYMIFEIKSQFLKLPGKQVAQQLLNAFVE